MPNRSESWSSFQHLLHILRERYESQRSTGKRPPRVVFILGAGTSLWSLMPLWREVKGDILNAGLAGFSDFLKEACIRLETTLGSDCRDVDDATRRKRLLQHASTDQLCAVACGIELCRERVLKRLQELFSGPCAGGAGLPPQLGYEMLAHMLKHGFADHVVTFNFDDLLTTAIRNEVGSDEFVLVASDHALGPSGSPADPELPRVIQLHGSVRAESTLRFTVDSTDVLTHPMKRILLDTLFPDDRPLHVVSLGYSWNDPDLCNWLGALAERIDTLTIVVRDRDHLSPRIREKPWEPRIIETAVLAVESAALSVDQLLWALWNELRECIVPPPPPAARHLILGHLFGPSVTHGGELVLTQPVNQHREDLRFAAEIALHVVKCQGMVTASMMARDLRIQRYRKSVAPRAFNRIIKRVLKPGSYPEVRETLFSEARDAREFAGLFTTLSLNVGDVLEPRLDPQEKGIRLVSREGMDFLEEHVARIQGSPEIEIVRNGDPRTQWLFDHAEPLGSFPLLEGRTEDVLCSDWTHLFAVAETGEWITRPAFRKALPGSGKDQRHLLMINASLPSEKDWKRKPLIDTSLDEAFAKLRKERGIDVCRAWMPWWQHNRHLSLAYDERSNTFLGAIFFQRPNKASRISPVFTSDSGDCIEVLVTFLTYVRRTLERQVFERTPCVEQETSTAKLEKGFVDRTLSVVDRIVAREPGSERLARLRALRQVIARLAGPALEDREITPTSSRRASSKRPRARPGARRRGKR